MKEIGSNFWDYKLENSNKKSLISNVKYTNLYDFESGRMAISALIKGLNISNSLVLLPIFTCESVIQPFLDNGCKVIYYPIDLNLIPDTHEIEKLVEKYSPKMILFHSYFGFNTNKNITKKFINFLKHHKVIVLEDITQSYFSKYKKIDANFYVTSLRKFFAIPMGGLLLLNDDLDIKYKKNINNDNAIDNVAIKAFDLKKKYINGDNVNKNDFMELYKEIKEKISHFDEIMPMSTISKQIFNGIDKKNIVNKRRKNYNYLLKKLGKNEKIKLIFNSLPKDVVPLYFPMYIEKRTEFQSFMASHNVFCPVIWPKSTYINDISNKEDYIYSNIICIPCDQRYNISDMERVCNFIFDFLKKY